MGTVDFVELDRGSTKTMDFAEETNDSVAQSFVDEGCS